MSSEKLTISEAKARIEGHFKGRCSVHADAYAQRITIGLPNGQAHELERSLYVRSHRLNNRLKSLSTAIDEWDAKSL